MRALVASGDSSRPLELLEVDEPQPLPSETVIDVKAMSINRGELRLLANRPRGWRPGQDVAGVVARQASDGSGPAAGTRVVALVDQAGWGERMAAPRNRVAALPDNVSFSQAATLPVAGLTALRALRLGGMLLGKTVLVTGATGGVGHLAVQLAARQGARVVGVVRNPERGKGLAKDGNVQLVEDLASAPGPFDLILESVGGASLTASLKQVAADGTVALFGNSAAEDSSVSFGNFGGHPRAKLYAFFVYESGEPPTFGSDLALLAGEISAGRLLPRVGLEVSWRDPLAAVEALRARRLEGKAVLTLD